MHKILNKLYLKQAVYLINPECQPEKNSENIHRIFLPKAYAIMSFFPPRLHG